MNDSNLKKELSLYSPSGSYDAAVDKMIARLQDYGGESFIQGIELAAQYKTVRALEKKGELAELDSVKRQAELTDRLIEILENKESEIRENEELVRVEMWVPKNTVDDGKKKEMLKALSDLFKIGQNHFRLSIFS